MICLAPMCDRPHAVTITLEVQGYLAHYPACWAHIEDVANTARLQNGQGASIGARSTRDGTIEASSSDAGETRPLALDVAKIGGHLRVTDQWLEDQAWARATVIDTTSEPVAGELGDGDEDARD